MTHLSGLGLKNFKVFKNYTEFNFAPLTLLTGANNSGKSSLIQALLLLADNVKLDLLKELDFAGTLSDIHHLGSFDLTLNNNNEAHKSMEFCIKYEKNEENYQLFLKYQQIDGVQCCEANFFTFDSTTKRQLHMVFLENAPKTIKDLSELKQDFVISTSAKSLILKKILNSLSFEYESAVRANSKRFYTIVSQGTSFNELLIKFNKQNLKPDGKEKEFINKWLKAFGIADKVEFVSREAYGTEIKLHRKGKILDLIDLGFGVTQLLPILMHIVICKTEYLILEEPENSLHPNFQSKLADLLVDVYREFKLYLIVETHSEYLLNRLRAMIVKKELIKTDIKVYFLENQDENYLNHEVDFAENGQIINAPSQFFETYFVDTMDIAMNA